MEDRTKKKLLAGGKVAFGVARFVGGVAVATGHGVLGTMFRNHHLMGNAMKIGGASVKAGREFVEDGIDEWKKA
jgi:hypothetical protein